MKMNWISLLCSVEFILNLTLFVFNSFVLSIVIENHLHVQNKANKHVWNYPGVSCFSKLADVLRMPLTGLRWWWAAAAADAADDAALFVAIALCHWTKFSVQRNHIHIHTHARFEYWTIDAKWFNETWCFQPKKNKRVMWHMQTRSIEKTTLIFDFITNTSTIDCSSISLAETNLFGHFSHSRLSFPSVSFHMLLQKNSLISNA